MEQFFRAVLIRREGNHGGVHLKVVSLVVGCEPVRHKHPESLAFWPPVQGERARVDVQTRNATSDQRLAATRLDHGQPNTASNCRNQDAIESRCETARLCE